MLHARDGVPELALTEVNFATPRAHKLTQILKALDLGILTLNIALLDIIKSLGISLVHLAANLGLDPACELRIPRNRDLVILPFRCPHVVPFALVQRAPIVFIGGKGLPRLCQIVDVLKPLLLSVVLLLSLDHLLEVFEPLF